jgi:DNA-damage-inducible protein D
VNENENKLEPEREQNASSDIVAESEQELTRVPSPNFDGIRQVNPYGVEYWSARELMPLLGYRSWREFEGAIKRAITALKQNSQAEVIDHFVVGYKPIIGGKGAVQQVRDYKLSRLACYLVAENGNSRIPQIGLAQTYFAVATHANELKELAEKQNQRLLLRERVAEGNKSLTKAAAQAGVESASFGNFHEAGYKGLYGGLGVEQVKARKGIGAKEDLLDRAGLAELGANALRIGLTEDLLRDGAHIGEAKAIQTHHEVGKRIRKAIAETGARLPEDLPAEPSVKSLLEARQKARKKVAAQKAQPQLTMHMFDEIGKVAEQDASNSGASDSSSVGKES